MAKYTLTTYCGSKELERYEHRSVAKLHSVIRHEKFYHGGETGPLGEPSKHPNHFVVIDSLRELIFEGKIDALVKFVNTL